MSHDFLTSLHSTVLGMPEEKHPAAKAQAGNEEEGKSAESLKLSVQHEPDRAKVDDRHRTIGVSMSPALRDRAVARAEAVGLSFSRYVQWCIQAELDGASIAERFKAKAE